MLHSKSLQAVVALGSEQVDGAMLVEDGGVAELGKEGEHGAVAHVVAVRMFTSSEKSPAFSPDSMMEPNSAPKEPSPKLKLWCR